MRKELRYFRYRVLNDFKTMHNKNREDVKKLTQYFGNELFKANNTIRELVDKIPTY